VATVHPCRKDQHSYQAIAGAIAGIGRRTCVMCGSVQIDLRSVGDEVGEGGSVFSARRPTLFSLHADPDSNESATVSAGFGMKRRLRR